MEEEEAKEKEEKKGVGFYTYGGIFVKQKHILKYVLI